jgi:hypothetical protein
MHHAFLERGFLVRGLEYLLDPHGEGGVFGGLCHLGGEAVLLKDANAVPEELVALPDAPESLGLGDGSVRLVTEEHHREVSGSVDVDSDSSELMHDGLDADSELVLVHSISWVAAPGVVGAMAGAVGTEGAGQSVGMFLPVALDVRWLQWEVVDVVVPGHRYDLRLAETAKARLHAADCLSDCSIARWRPAVVEGEDAAGWRGEVDDVVGVSLSDDLIVVVYDVHLAAAAFRKEDGGESLYG